MNYSPVRCPSCGSNAVLPAEKGRVYCKSCDTLFEKNSQPIPRPQKTANVPPEVRVVSPEEQAENKKLVMLTMFLLALISCMTILSYFYA